MKRQKTSQKPIHKSQDKLFRKSLRDKKVAVEFLLKYLDVSVANVLDFSTLLLVENEHISEEFNEVFCDVVFNCGYQNKSLGTTKIIILVEHQSTPEKLMPVRIYHYIYAMLHNEIKSRTSNKDAPLPAVCGLLFYNGLPKEYPYSLALVDCFYDPKNIMRQFFSNVINLVNVHDYSDDELLSSKLEGMMSFALKHSIDKQVDNALYTLIEHFLAIDSKEDSELQLFQLVLRFMFGRNSVKNPQRFIDYAKSLPDKVKGDVMNVAEQIKDWVIEERRLEAVIQEKREIAIKLLQKGADENLISEVTNLSIEQVAMLKDEL